MFIEHLCSKHCSKYVFTLTHLNPTMSLVLSLVYSSEGREKQFALSPLAKNGWVQDSNLSSLTSKQSVLLATLSSFLGRENENSRMKQYILLFLDLGYAVVGPSLYHVISAHVQSSGLSVMFINLSFFSSLFKICYDIASGSKTVL